MNKYFTPANACKAWYQPTRRNAANFSTISMYSVYACLVSVFLALLIANGGI